MTIRNIKCEGTPADLTPCQWLIKLLNMTLAGTRFKADIWEKKPGEIHVGGVRLKTNKIYCGNHPNACERPTAGRLRKGNWLEGADWVEFDDWVNDVCDEHCVECDFLSRDDFGKKWVLRDGRKRRVYYESEYVRGPGQNANWKATMDEGDFEEHFGATGIPASKFPEGTPGIHTKAGYAEADHH